MDKKAGLKDRENNREYALNKDKTGIGREGDNDIVLEDGAVSKHHAMILHKRHEYRLFDLKSTNGIKVNDEYVQKCVLNDGDRVEVGNTKFIFSKPAGLPGNRTSIVRMIAVFMSIAAILIVWYVTSPKPESNVEKENSSEYLALYSSGLKDYMKREEDVNYLRDAISKWRNALKKKPESVKIRKSLSVAESELNNKAEELYMAGKRLYDGGNLEQAISAWKKVREIVGSDSDLWKKADEGIRSR